MLRRTLLTGAAASAALACLAVCALAALEHNPRVQMVVAKRGTIVIELLPKQAPKTVAHFLGLVHKKFYDGILFHRVVPGFVAQAGDPKSKSVEGASIANVPAESTGLGEGGSGVTVPLEAGGAHERGSLGLARTQDPNTGDSQFFFNLVANHSLDGGYTVFGKVVSGLNVMDTIKQGDKIVSVREIVPPKTSNHA